MKLSCYSLSLANAALAVCLQGQTLEDDAHRLGVSAVDTGVRVSPLRVAKIDASGNIVGGWINWNEPGIEEDCGGSLCYDAFESDTRTGLPGDGFYGQDCGHGRARFFINNGDHDDRVFWEDFNAQGGCEGAEIGRFEHAWWWGAEGSGTSEHCVIFISILEDWGQTGDCSHGDFVDGVAVDFGTLQSSVDIGYYWADTALCFSNMTILGPADGSGSYKILYARDETGSLATSAQPMLWGDESRSTKDPTRPSIIPIPTTTERPIPVNV